MRLRHLLMYLGLAVALIIWGAQYCSLAVVGIQSLSRQRQGRLIAAAEHGLEALQFLACWFISSAARNENASVAANPADQDRNRQDQFISDGRRRGENGNLSSATARRTNAVTAASSSSPRSIFGMTRFVSNHRAAAAGQKIISNVRQITPEPRKRAHILDAVNKTQGVNHA